MLEESRPVARTHNTVTSYFKKRCTDFSKAPIASCVVCTHEVVVAICNYLYLCLALPISPDDQYNLT